MRSHVQSHTLVHASDAHCQAPASSASGRARVYCTQYSTVAAQHEALTNEDDGTGGPEKGGRKKRKKELKNRRESQCRKWQGGFLYLRKHCKVLKYRTWTQNGIWRLQQPFRTQSSATESSLTRNKELLPRHHWVIFSRGLIELNPAMNQNMCHQHQAWVKRQLALHLLGWQSFSSTVFHPNSFLLSVTLLASSLDASPCMPGVVLNYCTFQGTVL